MWALSGFITYMLHNKAVGLIRVGFHFIWAGGGMCKTIKRWINQHKTITEEFFELRVLHPVWPQWDHYFYVSFHDQKTRCYSSSDCKLISSSYFIVKKQLFRHHYTYPCMDVDSGNTKKSKKIDFHSKLSSYLGLILGLRPADERRRHFVTTSLIGWTQS